MNTPTKALDFSSFGTEKQIEALKKASFPTLDMSNFMVAMKIAKQYDLDPFAKEIWGWEQSGKTMIVVAYAGYLRIARQQPGFVQLETQPVFPKDEFEIDYIEKTITHKLNVKDTDKNDTPIGAWARITYISQGKERTNVKFVRWNEYARGNVWNTNKSAMITKVAGTVVIREVYGLSGLYTDVEISTPSPEEHRERTITPPDLSKIAPAVAEVDEEDVSDPDPEQKELFPNNQD